MASIITNGVVLKIPYAIIKNIKNARPWTLAVTGADPRVYAYDQLQLRSFPASSAAAKPGIFVYVGDVITFSLQAPCNSTGAAAYDLYSVNFTTGAETFAAQIGFNAVWQTQVKATISAIDASSGALTVTSTWM